MRQDARLGPFACATAALLALLAFSSPARAVKAERTVRPATYRALERIQSLMEREEYPEALERITVLEVRVAREPFEQALVAQTKAYVLLAQERYEEAIPVLARALEGDLLPEEATANLQYNLAQLKLLNGDAAGAAATLEAYFAKAEVAPTPVARALVGHAYYLLARYSDARGALERATAAMQVPPENWLRLLLGTYYELARFSDAEAVLRTLVARFPAERRYWIELSTIALHRGDEPLALASLELAENAGLLTGEDLVRLARLNLGLDAPVRAARLLESALAEARIEATARNFELLADAWVMAREYERSLPALSRAAELAPARHAELALRHGELLVHLERWEEAVTVLESLMREPASERVARANLLVGVAAYYQGQYARSLVAFGRAERHAATEQQAKQWSKQTIYRIEASGS